MEEIINELFQEGDRLVICFMNAAPFKGTFVKCSHGVIAANNKNGRLTLMRVEDINRVIKNNEIKTDEYAEDYPADLDTDRTEVQDEAAQERDPNLFEVELPELAAPKVLGRVDLTKLDPRRARRNQVTSPRLEEEQPDDDSGMKTAPMGVISSIGPKFGFIEDGGDVRYFNIGEVLKGWSNEAPLEKGDEVVFTAAENTHGKVAKCVHRPWTVSRQIRTAEHIAYRDQRNAKLLAAQLRDAFPDDEAVQDLLYSLHMA